MKNNLVLTLIFFFLSPFLIVGCGSKSEKNEKKLILSFYLDDTSPGIAGPEALGTFLDYCKTHGVKGESTVV
jgi:hypothetical protein